MKPANTQDQNDSTAPRRRPRTLAIAFVALVVLGAAAGAVIQWKKQPTKNVTAVARPDEHEGEHSEDGPKQVKLTEAAFATAQIEVQPVTPGTPAMTSPGLDVPGQVEFDPRRVAIISPRTAGRIEQLASVEGDHVGAGQTVALLNSKEFLTAENDLQLATRRAALLSGGPDAQGAAALVQAARRRLTLLGVTMGEIERVERGGEPALHLPVTAPFSGSITKAHAIQGQAVEAGAPIFTMADPSAIDVIAEVPERSVPMVRVGQVATVTLAALPTQPFAGRVERIRNELNPETRTVRTVIHVSNSTGQLRPGMFAMVRLAVPSSAYPELRTSADSNGTHQLLTIPESAVVTDGDRQYVFVQVAPMTFERREVQIAPLAPPGSSVANSAFVLVRSGVKMGERVVTGGAFTLKSELAKAGLGEHGH